MAATALMDVTDIANEVEVDRLDDELYEVVDGKRTRRLSMSAYSATIASRLVRKLGTFADDAGLGDQPSGKWLDFDCLNRSFCTPASRRRICLVRPLAVSE